MEWISVEDQLPEAYEGVIFAFRFHGQMVTTYGLWNGSRWIDTSAPDYENDPPIDPSDVTHWMPLPEPPETNE